MNHFKTKLGTELPVLNLRGKSYLQVAHRLVWFREEHPDWGIQTDLLEYTENHALAKAVIRDESGNIIATAHKYEDRKGFADFIEKAETGAMGRALAACGYGTQFAPELEEGERIVDSPTSQYRGSVPSIKSREPVQGVSKPLVPVPSKFPAFPGKTSQSAKEPGLPPKVEGVGRAENVWLRDAPTLPPKKPLLP